MIKCWYCNEELTSATYREEHIGICTNCYNSMFQGNKIVKGWIDKIADLEAKLAEKEEQLNNSEQKCLICHKDQENEQLKQQLAEKEKEFKWLHQKFAKFVEQNQDKISFCIEQLEKVRSFAYNTFKEFGCFDETDLEHILDNQIEELKKDNL